MDSMIKVGEPAPDFELNDLEGNRHTLKQYRGKVVVLNFWSAECPWSRRADKIILPLIAEWGGDVVVLSVASNANESLEAIADEAEDREVSPVLLDSDQHLARTMDAQITPEVFVIDVEGTLRYMGAFSDANFRSPEPNRIYLKEVVDSILAGNTPENDHFPAYGCTIYFGSSGPLIT